MRVWNVVERAGGGKRSGSGNIDAGLEMVAEAREGFIFGFKTAFDDHRADFYPIPSPSVLSELLGDWLRWQ